MSLQDYMSRVMSVARPLSVVHLLLPLQPPRRWKRGQKLNRGGRRRARARHAAKMAQAEIDACYVALYAYGPEAGGVPENYWERKTGEEILDEMRRFAGLMGVPPSVLSDPHGHTDRMPGYSAMQLEQQCAHKGGCGELLRPGFDLCPDHREAKGTTP